MVFSPGRVKSSRYHQEGMVNKLVRSCLQLCISEIPCNDNSACASLNLSKYEATVITTQSMHKKMILRISEEAKFQIKCAAAVWLRIYLVLCLPFRELIPHGRISVIYDNFPCYKLIRYFSLRQQEPHTVTMMKSRPGKYIG
jgi:hypothetical protein